MQVGFRVLSRLKSLRWKLHGSLCVCMCIYIYIYIYICVYIYIYIHSIHIYIYIYIYIWVLGFRASFGGLGFGV